MSALRCAVVGLGAMGRHHARLLAEIEDAELVVACDRDPERAAEHARLRGCDAAVDVRELSEDLDAVVVATPTSTHREIAEPLLRRGVTCLIEKPIASTLEDGRALVAAAQEGGAVLCVGHSERYNPGLARVRDDVRDPLFVESHRLGVFPARSLDVDVVLDLMIHDLDMLLWLTGGELEEVDAVGVNVLTPRVDIANARLVFSSGCTANVTASRVSAEITRKARFFREDGYVSVDLVAQRADRVHVAGSGEGREIRRDSVPDDRAAPKEEPLRAELVAFLRAARGEASDAVSGAEGLRALEAALRVLESMERHAREVAHRRGRR